MFSECRHGLNIPECAVCQPAPASASLGKNTRSRRAGNFSGIKVTVGGVGQPSADEARQNKLRRREQVESFISQLNEKGITRGLLFETVGFLDIHQQSGKPFKIEAQVTDYFLGKNARDVTAAVAECLALFGELVTKIQTDSEWERFVYQIAGNRFGFYKPLREEFLSLLGSKEMRSLLAENPKKFQANRSVIEDSAQKAYDSWNEEFQKRRSEELDKEVARLDLERKIPIRNVNGLSLEFMHPQDLVLLDLPAPKKPSSYRFPLHGF